VGVVVTDTAGRAWRDGQVDIAIGAAGVHVADDHAGRTDAHGNPLVVTRPAVADEIASAAELAQGKLAGRPFAVLRGRADLVLPDDEDGPGASALVRPEGADLFGFGAREAVVRALAADPEDQSVFGAPAHPEDLLLALRTALGPALRTAPATQPATTDAAAGPSGDSLTVELPVEATTGLGAVCFAHGWVSVDLAPVAHGRVRAHLRPVGP